jgi:hypothetical protein
MIRFFATAYFLFFCFLASAQVEDTTASIEYDTIIVVKDPVVVEEKFYLTKEPKVRKYTFSVFTGSGIVINYMNTCDCYSQKDWENAHKGEYSLSFSGAVTKSFKKKFGLELGLSADYIKQKYTDTLNNTNVSYSNQTVYAGIMTHVKYTLTPSGKKYGLAVYAGMKGMTAISQSGEIYSLANHPVTNELKTVTNPYAYGLSGRIEGSVPIGGYSRIFLGINYYYDLVAYTNKSFEYTLQRNIIGLVAGYQVAF